MRWWNTVVTVRSSESTMIARSRIVRSHSSNWPSRRQSSTIVWTIARILAGVGSMSVREAASTASAIIRMPEDRASTASGPE